MTIHRIHFGNRTLEFEEARQGVLRWAVGSAEGLHSSTWRLWDNKKGDVYLSVGSLGGSVKASFHRDRRCQVGFTSNYELIARERYGVPNRHWGRWALENSPIVRAVWIIVPAYELRIFNNNKKNEMKWLPEPEGECASVVSIFIAEPPSDNWPYIEDGAKPIGLMVRPTRMTLAMFSEIRIDANTKNIIKDAQKKIANSAMVLRKPGVRMILPGAIGTPNFHFVETAWD